MPDAGEHMLASSYWHQRKLYLDSGDPAALETMLANVTETHPDLDEIRKLPWPGDPRGIDQLARRVHGGMWLVIAVYIAGVLLMVAIIGGK